MEISTKFCLTPIRMASSRKQITIRNKMVIEWHYLVSLLSDTKLPIELVRFSFYLILLYPTYTIAEVSRHGHKDWKHRKYRLLRWKSVKRSCWWWRSLVQPGHTAVKTEEIITSSQKLTVRKHGVLKTSIALIMYKGRGHERWNMLHIKLGESGHQRVESLDPGNHHRSLKYEL